MKITRSDNTALTLLLTNETCFNCFGTRSSDANRNNKKTTKLPWKFKSYATSLDPPPLPLLGGKGGSPRWRQYLMEKWQRWAWFCGVNNHRVWLSVVIDCAEIFAHANIFAKSKPFTDESKSWKIRRSKISWKYPFNYCCTKLFSQTDYLLRATDFTRELVSLYI